MMITTKSIVSCNVIKHELVLVFNMICKWLQFAMIIYGEAPRRFVTNWIKVIVGHYVIIWVWIIIGNMVVKEIFYRIECPYGNRPAQVRYVMEWWAAHKYTAPLSLSLYMLHFGMTQWQYSPPVKISSNASFKWGFKSKIWFFFLQFKYLLKVS